MRSSSTTATLSSFHPTPHLNAPHQPLNRTIRIYKPHGRVYVKMASAVSACLRNSHQSQNPLFNSPTAPGSRPNPFQHFIRITDHCTRLQTSYRLECCWCLCKSPYTTQVGIHPAMPILCVYIPSSTRASSEYDFGIYSDTLAKEIGWGPLLI